MRTICILNYYLPYLKILKILFYLFFKQRKEPIWVPKLDFFSWYLYLNSLCVSAYCNLMVLQVEGDWTRIALVVGSLEHEAQILFSAFILPPRPRSADAATCSAGRASFTTFLSLTTLGESAPSATSPFTARTLKGIRIQQMVKVTFSFKWRKREP